MVEFRALEDYRRTETPKLRIRNLKQLPTRRRKTDALDQPRTIQSRFCEVLLTEEDVSRVRGREVGGDNKS